MEKRMKIEIRNASFQDCEALCEIHVSAIRGLCKSHYSKEDIDAWSRNRIPEQYEKHIRERQVVIAQHRSIPVGFGTLDLTKGEIVQLYVRPGYARKGVGKQILEQLLSIARASGLREVHCKSSLNAQAFYANAGFESGQKCKHRLRNGGELDCIPMKKRLE